MAHAKRKTTWLDIKAIKTHPGLIEQILDAYALTDNAERKGTETRIRCLFHDDKRPSCNVNTDKNIYHCWSCEARGNVIDLVAHLESLAFVDAARLIHTRFISTAAVSAVAEYNPAVHDPPAATQPEDKKPATEDASAAVNPPLRAPVPHANTRPHDRYPPPLWRWPPRWQGHNGRSLRHPHPQRERRASAPSSIRIRTVKQRSPCKIGPFGL